MSRLEGKIAVVTGAGRGLGAAISELFASEGARVVAADVDQASAAATARRILDAGGESVGLGADVTSAADAERLVQTAVERFGGLHVLVNNAGIASAGGVCEVSESEWDRVMAVNLKGSFLCSRYAVAHMARSGGGSIVCIASASGVIGQRAQVAYNVSKHGVIGLVRCMALDHAADGIRVNAVCPGTTRTPLLDALSEEQLAALQEMHPLGRLAEPAEIARAVLHLAADESSFTHWSGVPRRRRPDRDVAVISPACADRGGNYAHQQGVQHFGPTAAGWALHEHEEGVRMKVKTFDHVAVTVSDTERALEFYVGKLGLRQAENHQLEGDKVDEASGLVGARAQSTRLLAPESPDILIDLLEYYEPDGQTHITPMGSVGSCHFALVVDDLPGAVEELKAKGVPFISGPVNFELTEGSVSVCFCQDPDGNYVELMEEYDH